MQQQTRLAVLLTLSAILLSLHQFVPVGGPLCGPVCPPEGPQHWERTCIGRVERERVADGYTDRCRGIPYGARRCYGLVPEQPTGATPTPERRLVRIPCPE